MEIRDLNGNAPLLRTNHPSRKNPVFFSHGRVLASLWLSYYCNTNLTKQCFQCSNLLWPVNEHSIFSFLHMNTKNNQIKINCSVSSWIYWGKREKRRQKRELFYPSQIPSLYVVPKCHTVSTCKYFFKGRENCPTFLKVGKIHCKKLVFITQKKKYLIKVCIPRYSTVKLYRS